MKLSKTQLIPFSITFISVGLLLAVALFLVFTNQPTVALILGLVSGLTFAMVLVFGIHRYISFRKDQTDEQDENTPAVGFGELLAAKLGINASVAQTKAVGQKIEFLIKGFAASWTLFGAIAIALSTALYYATVLQARQLEAQNTIVTKQTRLLCVQNNLSAKANRFALYQLKERKFAESSGALKALIEQFSESLRRVGRCENNDCGTADVLLMHEVNSDYKLYRSSAFENPESLIQSDQLYEGWRAAYSTYLKQYGSPVSTVSVLKEYHSNLTALNTFAKEELIGLKLALTDLEKTLDDDLEQCD